jgi:HlyD family secretion protein
MTSQDKPDLSSLRITRDAQDRVSAPRKFPWAVVLAASIIILLGTAWMVFRNGSTMTVELVSASMTSPSQASAVLTASGYVVAQRKAAVASKGTGRLMYLGVEEGDHVKQGEVIARLEDADVIAALAQARANLAIALADSNDARSSLERIRTLFAAGLASQSDLDPAKGRYDRVVAGIRFARASVDAAQVAVENTRIRAPFDGTVLTKNADVGEVVAPFASSANSRGAVVSIADMKSLLVEADVSESNITRVGVGQPCEITLDAYPDKRYKGFVHKIVPTADRAKATVLTKVGFAERDDRVLPEMSAKVAFLSPETPQSTFAAPAKLTIPQSALTERRGEPVVFVAHEGTAVETSVKAGERLGSQIEILTGLRAGESVVNHPPGNLADGQKIKTQ